MEAGVKKIVRRKRRTTISSRRNEWHASGWKTYHSRDTHRRGNNSILSKRRRLSGDVEAAHGPWWTSVADGWSLLKAFCDNTSLHGLRYVTADGMPVIHRQLLMFDVVFQYCYGLLRVLRVY